MKESIILSILFIIHYKTQSNSALKLTPNMVKKVHVVTKALVVFDAKTYYQIFVMLQGVNTTWIWA